jgi:hypothetical protein
MTSLSPSFEQAELLELCKLPGLPPLEVRQSPLIVSLHGSSRLRSSQPLETFPHDYRVTPLVGWSLDRGLAPLSGVLCSPKVDHTRASQTSSRRQLDRGRADLESSRNVHIARGRLIESDRNPPLRKLTRKCPWLLIGRRQGSFVESARGERPCSRASTPGRSGSPTSPPS